MIKKCKVRLFICRFFIACFMALIPSVALADWQATLEEHFGIVETFDQLSDWSQTSTGYITTPSAMPKKQDGAASIWNTYMTDFNHNSGDSGDVISDHGEYSWNRSGSSTSKSFCLQHNVLYESADDADQGYGVQRLGTFFGDGSSGKSGYKKIHIFFMVKFRPGYFAIKSGTTSDYAWLGYLKFFELMTGFTGINHWGTAADRDSSNGSIAVLESYGCNATVINFQTGGATYGEDKLFPYETTLTAVDSDDGWKYEAPIQRHIQPGSGSMSIADSYEANEWIGMEIAVDEGTVNVSDGTIDFYIYNESGTEIGHWSKTGEARLKHFDHRWNQIILGGNRTVSTGDNDVIPDETRAYIDDFIVDDSQIGPTYFELLRNESITVEPAENLRSETLQ